MFPLLENSLIINREKIQQQQQKAFRINYNRFF